VSSTQEWQDAEAIARTVADGDVVKRSDGIPFFFMDDGRGVLVHQGKIVTDRGPAAAGAYLRDLGVIDGGGPQIADVLTMLWYFDAWPEGIEVERESYVNSPKAARLRELNARVEGDGTEGRVVLHYFLPEPPHRENVQVGEDMGPPKPRPVLRAVLHIPRSGDARWELTRIEWMDPARMPAND